MHAVEYHVKMMDHWFDEDKRKKELDGVQKKVGQFRDYFDQNCIWLDEETREKVRAVLEEDTEGLFYRFTHAASLERAGLGKDRIPQKMLELWEKADKSLPAARQALEAQFRKALTTERASHSGA